MLRMRTFSYASLFASDDFRERLTEHSFRCIRELLIETNLSKDALIRNPVISRDEVGAQYPLRVNWCGTWTDTPPFCLENGGAVVNASVKINGRLPVEVRVKKLEESKAVLEFSDSGYRTAYFHETELSDCSNPLDPFLLIKAALISAGLISLNRSASSDTVFERLGGGFQITAGVPGIPKGSGLGTSSILLTACIKAILDFVGKTVTEQDLYRRVLVAEQLMGTGGGWQDQAGGFTPGIKIARAQPGLIQTVNREQLNVSETFANELASRFYLIYSGQRRLGRTILREIMARYIQADPLVISSLKTILTLAEDMKKSIESNDFDGFTETLNYQTALTCKLDTGYSNELLNTVFYACEDMTAGKMICGAGGGGFVQIIIKKGCSREDLRTVLQKKFPGQSVNIWNCIFY